MLKVAHHGSKTSTSAPFVDAVKPSYAVISTDGVSYGHPADTTINTLTDSGAKVFRTDIEGNIMFSLSANNKLAYVYGNIDITPLKIEIRYIILILDAVFVFVIVKIVFFSSKINKHKK